MKHARADYDAIQDTTAAHALARLVLAMPVAPENGLEARRLAGEVLGGVQDSSAVPQDIAPQIPLEEPVFLIRGQDAVGGAAVRAWADLAEAQGAAPDILQLARTHAAKMDCWPKKKTADLPKAPPR